ncbi:MAG: UDP-N-acetylmuramate dehydrogenase [Actinomycetota bacterium]
MLPPSFSAKPRLADLTTTRVGGRAERFLDLATTDEVVDALQQIDHVGHPLLVIGGGSNMLVSDEPVSGTVLRIATRGIKVESTDDCAGVMVRVAAGEPWDDFVQHAVASGWVGVEALSGIPGSTGATPIQNVGAYGQEVAQTIARVRVWDRASQRVVTVAHADCRFAYRHSAFKNVPFRGWTGRYIVLDVTFQLRQGDLSAPLGYADLARGLGVALGDRVPLAAARSAVLDQRGKRGMVLDPNDHDTWSTGSFFTNPILSPSAFTKLKQRVSDRLGENAEPPAYLMSHNPHTSKAGDGLTTQPLGSEAMKTSAAWLIERAGFHRGYGLPGPAALSTKHTLALTNRGQATAADVIALAREVRDGVADAFGVRLVPEPVLVGMDW